MLAMLAMLAIGVPTQFALTIALGLVSLALTLGAPLLWLEYCRRTNQSIDLRSPVALRKRRERL